MTWSETVDAYLPSDDTVAYNKYTMPQSWLWDPPSPLPEMWVAPPPPAIVAPHLPMRYFKVFTGHKFGFGGKK